MNTEYRHGADSGLFFSLDIDNCNMGYAEIEYETRQAAESTVLHWDKGQLDGEVVEAIFIPRITRPPRPSERPVRARVPLSPPRRGPRRQGNYSLLNNGN